LLLYSYTVPCLCCKYVIKKQTIQMLPIEENAYIKVVEASILVKDVHVYLGYCIYTLCMSKELLFVSKNV